MEKCPHKRTNKKEIHTETNYVNWILCPRDGGEGVARGAPEGCTPCTLQLRSGKYSQHAAREWGGVSLMAVILKQPTGYLRLKQVSKMLRNMEAGFLTQHGRGAQGKCSPQDRRGSPAHRARREERTASTWPLVTSINKVCVLCFQPGNGRHEVVQVSTLQDHAFRENRQWRPQIA